MTDQPAGHQHRIAGEALLNPLRRALADVLRTMTGLELIETQKEPALQHYPEGQLSALILLTGPTNLLLSLTMPRETLATLVSYMTGIPAFELTEADLSDGTLELANMTAGQSKTFLAELGYRFQISAPFGIAGKQYDIFSKERVPQVTEVFQVENMELWLRVYEI